MHGPDQSVTIPNSVISIGLEAFRECIRLTSVTIGSSVTSIEDGVFANCYHLISVYFRGDAPDLSGEFGGANARSLVYYLPGTRGWGETFGDLPTALWNPLIQASGPGFGVGPTGFGFNITGTADIPVVVEACTNLANPKRSPLATNTLTGGSSYFSDPQWTNHLNHFYRIRSPLWIRFGAAYASK